jgi:hypothetical protein
MNALPTRVSRVVVLAHPAVGRKVENILHRSRHKVHRTPDDCHLRHLVARPRPDLVITALDIPRIGAAAVMHHLITRARTIPALVLGEVAQAPDSTGFPSCR